MVILDPPEVSYDVEYTDVRLEWNVTEQSLYENFPLLDFHIEFISSCEKFDVIYNSSYLRIRELHTTANSFVYGEILQYPYTNYAVKLSMKTHVGSQWSEPKTLNITTYDSGVELTDSPSIIEGYTFYLDYEKSELTIYWKDLQEDCPEGGSSCYVFKFSDYSKKKPFKLQSKSSVSASFKIVQTLDKLERISIEKPTERIGETRMLAAINIPGQRERLKNPLKISLRKFNENYIQVSWDYNLTDTNKECLESKCTNYINKFTPIEKIARKS
jgi:hypothetical protein